MIYLAFILIAVALGYACCVAGGRADEQSEAWQRSRQNQTLAGKGENIL